MSFEFELTIDDREFERMVRNGDKIYRAAAASALNKAMGEVRTQAVREIGRKVRLPIRMVRRRTFIRRATTRAIIAQLKVYAKPVNPAAITRTQMHGSPVRVVSGHVMPPKSFLMRPVRGGAIVAHRGPRAAGSSGFDSKGRHKKDRLPVEVAKIKIFAEANATVKLALAEGGKAAFEKHLPHELEFRLQRAAKGG